MRPTRQSIKLRCRWGLAGILRNRNRPELDLDIELSVIKIVIEMATGAGKSLVIAELARLIYEYTGQRTIVTAPKGELVKQNAAKFRALGLECSIFSAKAGKKCLKHPVVFCSPGYFWMALAQLVNERFQLRILSGAVWIPKI